MRSKISIAVIALSLSICAPFTVSAHEVISPHVIESTELDSKYPFFMESLVFGTGVTLRSLHERSILVQPDTNLIYIEQFGGAAMNDGMPGDENVAWKPFSHEQASVAMARLNYEPGWRM